MVEQQETRNQLTDLMDRFKSVQNLMDSFLQHAYERHGIDPIEIAIYMNIISGQQLDRVFHEYMGLSVDKIKEIASEQIRIYNETGTINKSTFVGELIGLHSVLGVKLTKMNLLINDLKGIEAVGD